MVRMRGCVGPHRAPMRMPLAATSGAPTKDATPALFATASASFTLHSRIRSFGQHASPSPTVCHALWAQRRPQSVTALGQWECPQRQALADASPHDAVEVAVVAPGIFVGILHDGDFIIGALQAALQEGQDPLGARACLAQPCAAPHEHLRMRAEL